MKKIKILLPSVIALIIAIGIMSFAGPNSEKQAAPQKTTARIWFNYVGPDPELPSSYEPFVFPDSESDCIGEFQLCAIFACSVEGEPDLSDMDLMEQIELAINNGNYDDNVVKKRAE